MIICFYSCHSNISDRDGDIVYYVGEKGVGYFLWSSSLIIVFLLNIFSPDFFKSKRNKPTKDYFRTFLKVSETNLLKIILDFYRFDLTD